MWYRVCVDVTPRGEVRGWSIEVRDEEGIVTVLVHPVGPFESPAEILQEALAEAYGRWGVQDTLF
jgi:hypothetical protein